MQLVREHNEFHPKIDNKSLYLDFYMKGSCSKGADCHYLSFHSYIP